MTTAPTIRSEILKLARKNALEGGSEDVTMTLLTAYSEAAHEDEISFRAIAPIAAESLCMSLYVAERKRLAPRRGFDDAHYEAIYEYPLATSGRDIPERFVRNLAVGMAVRDHIQDEAMYTAFVATQHEPIG